MEFWYLLPTGILIAALGMSSGVSGSNFWIPVYLLWMQLEPRVAFWTSLLTMLFGFGSGVARNLWAGTIDKVLFARYAKIMAPATLVGALISPRLPTVALLLSFAIFVIAFALFVLWDSRPGRPQPAPHEKTFVWVAATGGFLHGSIATGSGTLMLPCLLNHRRLPHHATAVGTTVSLAFLCSVLSVSFRLDAELIGALWKNRELVGSMIVFAAPGVIVGGQLGPIIAKHLPRAWLRRYVALLLIGVGSLVALRALA